LWIHDAVGIFVTPFATAMAYFVIPAVARKPIYSHFYSMIGSWLLFLVNRPLSWRLCTSSRCVQPGWFSSVVVWDAVQHGVPGTSMPAWNELSGPEFKAVGDYVLSLENTPELRPGEQWATQGNLFLAGQPIFNTHCTRCHGENGTGDGPDGRQYLPRPANVQQIKLSYTGAPDVIHNGVPGSGMPAWPLLTPQEIQAVTYYMRSLSQGPATVAAESSRMEDMP
jgi:mono/diheme cytochrome c family protein